jgi:hypothetical protein
MVNPNKFTMKDGVCIMIAYYKGEPFEVKIDRKNYKKIKQYRWRIHKGGYCGALLYAVADIDKKFVRLHRFLMDVPKNMQVDHKNHDTVDNREENLRICTVSENMHNSKKPKNNTSGFKGVSWHKVHKKWHAQIYVKNKNIYLGRFTDKIEAAKAYNDAAIKYHGEFASLNKIAVISK